MRIVVAATYVPFTTEGEARIADDLVAALAGAGHLAAAVKLPFDSKSRSSLERIMAFRLLDLTDACGSPIDRLITIGSPSHALPHPNKVAWFGHSQHGAFDCADSGLTEPANTGETRGVRDILKRADTHYLREARRIYASCRAVAERLATCNGLKIDGVLPVPRSGGNAQRTPELHGVSWRNIVDKLAA